MDWHRIDGFVADWHRIGGLVMDYQVGLVLALNWWIGVGSGFGPRLAWEWKIGIGLTQDWKWIGDGLAMDW